MTYCFEIRDNITHKSANPTNFAKFISEVEDCARKRPLRGSHMPVAASLANLRSNMYCIEQLLNVTRRCTYIKHDRTRCKCWAMTRGATLCHHHGGYRQNADHPATKRALAIGLMYQMSRNRLAKRTLAKMETPEDRVAKRAAREALRLQGHKGPISDAVLNGACAFQRPDAGKSWRTWLREISNRGRQTT